MLRSTVTAEQSHSVCHPEAASSLQSAAHSSCKSGRLEKPVVTAVRYNVCVCMCVCTRWQNCWTLTPGLYHNELSIVGLIVRREKVKGVKVNQTGRKTESSVIRPFIIWAIHTHTHKTRRKHCRGKVVLLRGWFQICISHFWHSGHSPGMSSKLYNITETGAQQTAVKNHTSP